MDLDRQTLITAGAVFVIFVFAGFYLAFQSEPQKQKFVESMNVTADSDNEIVTASFDNQSLDLMHEDQTRARFYLDLNQDGASDIELDVVRNGTVQETTQVVTFGEKSYRLHLRYKDALDRNDDSWIRIYRVVEL